MARTVDGRIAVPRPRISDRRRQFATGTLFFA